MIVFFQCVAETIAERGLRGLSELVPGGAAMYDIAKGVWEKFCQRCKEGKQREEIQQLAQVNFVEAKNAAAEAVKPIAASHPEILPVLELYLTQIPTSIRQSLKRSDDPTGITLPATFSLRGPEDVAKLLPLGLPCFTPGDPLPGRPGWRLERPIGAGGFGEVWLTRHPQYKSLVRAVKFCRNLNTRDRDLLHESKVIDQLLQQGPHAHIVKLEDVYLDGETPWLMYEYVEGGDLTDLVHELAGLPPTERQNKVIGVLTELAETVAYCHRLDPPIVHRDLKPANILRDKKGLLRITDFGISGIVAQRMIENETRGTTTRSGRLQSYLYGSYTPLYASPQQKDGAEPDPRDDVHALGVIAYQLITGHVNQGVGSDLAEDLKEAGVQETFIELLRQCTAAKAERRPKDAAALSTELRERILANDSVEIERRRVAKEAAATEKRRLELERKQTRQRESDRLKIIEAEKEMMRLRLKQEAAESRRRTAELAKRVGRITAKTIIFILISLAKTVLFIPISLCCTLLGYFIGGLLSVLLILVGGIIILVLLSLLGATSPRIADWFGSFCIGACIIGAVIGSIIGFIIGVRICVHINRRWQ